MRKKLLLLSEDALSFDAIAPDLFGKKIVMVNVYAVRGGARSWTLIDAALYFSTDRILRWTEEKFGNTPPDSILLTHGHFDHIGALQELADYWDVPIYAH
ncbi:MAG: MBL fold metallo-hydrolase, partial [Acidobacteriota bacterium]|nr:MBL fold metallo-hydrolase [Acidobacteriota bacterium]